MLLLACALKVQPKQIKQRLEIKLAVSWANHSFYVSIPRPRKIKYKEDLGGGTALPETPETERVKRNQRNISTVLNRVMPPPQPPPPLHVSSPSSIKE